MSTADDMEIVNFPVPKRYLPAVVHALSAAMHEDDTDSDGQAVESIGTNQEIDWSHVEQCKRLRNELKAPAACTLLDLTAETPNTWISFAKLVEMSGRSKTQARGDLVALTKAVKRIYGVPKEQARWPVEFQWAAEEQKQAYYRMSESVAKAWKQSASQ